MNGFILAAGLGTRFQPLTLTIPKPLIPILGKPAIEYSLDTMKRIGIEEVVINTYHLAGKIEDYLGDGRRWGLRIKYSYEEELLGTAGGFVKASPLFTNPGTTLILSSDVVTNAKIEAVIAFHREHMAEFTVGVLERDDVTGSGILKFNDDGRVVRFMEKPTAPDEVFSHWVNGSIYVVEPSVLDFLPPIGAFSDFGKDLFPTMIERDAGLFACPLSPPWNYLVGIDSPELLKQVETDILNSKVFNER